MRKKYVVILCISLAVLVACAVLLICRAAENRRADDEYNNLTDAVTIPTESPEPEEPYVSPIDFEELWAINPDVIAWIKVPGTDIDYPVMYSKADNSYYLNHNIYGEELISASIFVEYYNHSNFSDFNTVIYGHNMNDGSMFGQLHRYEDADFFSENRTVYIYLPDRTLTYNIFAAHFVSNDHILGVCKNKDPKSCAAYIESIFADKSSDASIDGSVSVTADDRIITLATCDRYKRDQRFVIHAVLAE